MLKKARENATRENVEITFIKEDIVNLSFESTFDAVCSNTALEFMGNKELAIRLMLKEGGSFVVGTINKESSWYEFYEAFAIFKYATFISPKETIKKGLFVPPDIEEAFIDLNDLEVRVEGEKGGYILWWRK